jgi:hypothetical protein
MRTSHHLNIESRFCFGLIICHFPHLIVTSLSLFVSPMQKKSTLSIILKMQHRHRSLQQAHAHSHQPTGL